jgi:hypothetical protein
MSYELDELLPGVGWDNPVEMGATPQRKADLLIELITSAIQPKSWHTAGGKGQIEYHPLDGTLHVCQTLDVQYHIQTLLQTLRQFRTEPEEPGQFMGMQPLMMERAPDMCVRVPMMPEPRAPFGMMAPPFAPWPPPPNPGLYQCITPPAPANSQAALPPPPPAPGSIMPCMAAPQQPFGFVSSQLPGAHCNTTNGHCWTVRCAHDEGKIALQMQNDSATCMIGETFQIKVPGEGPVKVALSDQQLKVSAAHFHATADCVAGTDKPGCICLEGHVRFKCHKDGQHVEGVADQVTVGLADGHVEIKTNVVGPIPPTPNKIAVGQALNQLWFAPK